jgi:neopullulanase
MFMLLAGSRMMGQVTYDRIEPPFWWTGMQDTTLMLMVHGNHVAEANVVVDNKYVKLASVRRVENPNYVFIDLLIPKNTKAGKVKLVFEYQREILFKVDYELKERAEGSAQRRGFGKDDVIYLLMPDRFSNGDPLNDSVPGILEGAHPGDPNGRHGGDIVGISGEVDYLSKLGVTGVWITPLLENNQPKYSYHGYAITDYYKIDPRYGTNAQYLDLVEDIHEKGMKVIMDMVFNHCGSNHWWIQDMPMESWVHQFPEFTRSNFRAETIMDPYASDFDRERMLTGWFDRNMPDLNQHNPVLAKYLIQNSIWWIEYAGLDGIRMDTYPYSYKDFLAEWMQSIHLEYPNFSVVGETWLQKESHTGWWQDGSPANEGYKSNLDFVTDFPTYFALKDAFVENEGWTTGLARMYYVLSQDYVYSDPFNCIIFADNHDLTRIYTSLGEDYNKFKMAMTYLFTTRGIPVMYYGTELLMTGVKEKGDGYIRQDFPEGSWQSAVSSQQSAVRNSESGIRNPEQTAMQQDALNYMTTLLNWRKGSDVIHNGRLKQFVPQDGIYVYFRYTDNDAVMVVINKNKESKDLDLARFREVLKDYSTGKDVVTRGTYELKTVLRVPAETALVLELE